MNWSAELYTKTGLGTLLEEALSQGATEVHFKVPKPVLFRVDGVLIDTLSPIVRPQTTNQIGASLCALAGRSEDITVVRDLEFSFGMMGIGRFHVVLYRQRGTLGIIVRPASFHSPTLDSLGLDSATIAPYLQRPGLIVVMGTTHTQPYLAALVQQFNETSPGFVVTIADPITHLFRDQLATIAQHDIGTDTHSFADGVSHASRRGADLIVPFTVNNFETGHSVLQAVEYGSTLIIGLPVSNSSEIADWFCRTQPRQHNTTLERVEKALTLTIGVNSEGSPSLTSHN